MKKILLIEDDADIAKIIQHYLSGKEYSVEHAGSAAEAYGLARKRFDVILLDILLPDEDGFTVCARLRGIHNCPIIFISCLDDSDSILRAFELGGDDYLAKPFDEKVLEARIKAALRHTAWIERHRGDCRVLSCADFSLDCEQRLVLRAGQEFPLTALEYQILLFFMEHPGAYYTPEELYRIIWNKDSYGDVRTVIVHIHSLRKKIESDKDNPQRLVRVRGRGYAFCP